MKQTLKLNDYVMMHSTNSDELDNNYGTLMGVACEFPGNNFWIVELDNPLADHRAIVLTDSCLTYAGEE